MTSLRFTPLYYQGLTHDLTRLCLRIFRVYNAGNPKVRLLPKKSLETTGRVWDMLWKSPPEMVVNRPNVIKFYLRNINS